MQDAVNAGSDGSHGGRRLVAALWERLEGESAWLMAGEAFNRGGRFLLLLLLARAVGAESYGAWVIAVATATILANGGDAGLATVVTREIAADRARTRQYLANLWTAAPLLTLLGFGLLLALSPVLVRGTSLLLLLVVGVGGTLESAAFLLLSPLRAQGRMRPEGLLRAFQGSVLLVVGGMAVFMGGGRVAAVAPVFPAVAAASLLVAVVGLLRSVGPVRPEFDWRLLRRLLRSALPVFGATVAFFVYFRIDAFLLAALKGEEATGLYGAAYNFAFGLAFLPLMFGRAALPRFAACETPAALRAVYLRSSAVVALCAGGISAFLVLAAPLFLLLYGSDFAGAQTPYLLLVIAQALYFFTHLNYMLMFARGRAGTGWGLTLLALAVNLAANSLLIPSLGASGAALAMIISETVLLGTQLAFVRTLMRPAAGFRALVAPVAGGDKARARAA